MIATEHSIIDTADTPAKSRLSPELQADLVKLHLVKFLPVLKPVMGQPE